ncbi:MAG: signal peptidase I [Armatimonadetes bacterium]|nr:signal peptidase I [Armatimonadota bacterium]
MEWLAGLSIEWILLFAFILVFARLGLYLSRRFLGTKADAYGGELIESLLCAWVVIFLFVKPFLYEQFSIPSGSMIPTLNIGDRIAVNKYVYRFNPPERGDIIVFKSPPTARQDEADFVKRLVGMPGDTVDIRQGQVYVNSRPLKESYVYEPNATEPEPNYPGSIHFPYRVPKDRYLMLGDNRRDSFDSRVWGLVEPERIKGKAVLKLWPFSNFGILH